MSETNIWLISPRDPLIFRNGKPFTAAPGSRAETLPLPYPGTVSGAARTMAWTNNITDFFDESLISDAYIVHAPLLVELDASDNVEAWYFPAPSDAVFFETTEKSKEKADLFDLKPMPSQPDVMLDCKDMILCGFAKNLKQKPFKSPPSFWNWTSLVKWLSNPVSQSDVNLQAVGIANLPLQYRIHVAMENSRQTAKDEGLFQTSGVEFDYKTNLSSKLQETRRFGLVVTSDLDFQGGGLGHLGGEKRFVDWLPLKTELPFQTCPQDIHDEIVKTGYCRILLVTPAYFGGKNLPGKTLTDLGAEVIAVINDRFQTVSGWDYQKKRPKATKHLVPSGSVFFLKLSDNLDKRKQFVNQIWGQTIGDDPQMNSDGYGLSLLGNWDGNLRSMTMEESHDH